MSLHQVKTGDCECCPNLNCRITLMHGNMWMCDECKAKDDALKAELNEKAQQKKLDAILDKSRVIDQSINVKTDLFNAATIPAIELKAAIDADESIPADQKHFRYTDEAYTRFLQFKQAVFQQRQQLVEAENTMRMWQTQVRTSAATLKAEQREKYKTEDLNYTPVTPKSPKPAAPKTGKKFDKEAVLEAARKYDIPMAAVQLICNARHVSPEVSARHQRLMADKKECDCVICTTKGRAK
jgi:hypothetical protein